MLLKDGRSKGNADMNSPLISVIIPYYKRREIIGQCLDSVFSQDYVCREVIVIDNHSEDDVREVIERKGLDVRLIELSSNAGACAARNAGIQAARGEILVFIDDDMGFMSPFELSKMVKAFESHPSHDVLAFRVCDPDTGGIRVREWCHPRYWKDFSESEFETLWFCEGASAFKRKVFEACGTYYEPLFYGPEGWDLAVRVLDHGFRILYCPQLRAWHRPSSIGRSFDRQVFYFTRDYVWMAYKDYRIIDGLRFLVPKLAMMAYFTLRCGAYYAFLRGFRDGFTGLPGLRKHRTPISKTTVAYLAALEKSRPSIFVRLARHRSSIQL